jgi:hypothetical protein
VLGWTCSSRASRGSAPAASRLLAHAAHRAPCGAGHRAGDARPHRAGQLDPVADPAGESAPTHRGELRGGVVGDITQSLGSFAVAVAPAHPVGDRRPGDGVGRRADHQAEMASVETQLVDVGPRRGETDRAHAGGGRNLIHAPDHREDRGLDVGESQETIIDHEAALEHPVVGDELVQEVSHRRARPLPSRRPRGSGAGAREAAGPRGRGAEGGTRSDCGLT